MRSPRPKELSPAARERMKQDSCEKCARLTTAGKRPSCTAGHAQLVLCADFEDASKASPRPEGGIVRLYHYPG